MSLKCPQGQCRALPRHRRYGASGRRALVTSVWLAAMAWAVVGFGQRRDVLAELEFSLARVEAVADHEVIIVRHVPASWLDVRGDEAVNVTVHVEGNAAADKISVLGDQRVDQGRLLFVPRFPFQPGITYRVVAQVAGRQRTKLLRMPSLAPRPATSVVHVYPSETTLPENLLKFYVHFSQPMSRGEAYRRIRLVREGVGEVESPFLELGEELWDPSGRRFTLFFDPGRIKRGLRPREEVGPALEAGAEYRLEIDRRWKDARAQPLDKPFVKRFRVGNPDYRQPDPKEWKIVAPPAGTNDPLTVYLDEPLDHAMLTRVISVITSTGEVVHGRPDTAQSETKWQFHPESAWSGGRHQLLVQTHLEDLAGNSIARPFEVDLFQTVQREIKQDTMRVPFDVR